MGLVSGVVWELVMAVVLELCMAADLGLVSGVVWELVMAEVLELCMVVDLGLVGVADLGLVVVVTALAEALLKQTQYLPYRPISFQNHRRYSTHLRYFLYRQRP